MIKSLPGLLLASCTLIFIQIDARAQDTPASPALDWKSAIQQGDYDLAVALSDEDEADGSLSTLLQLVRQKQLADDPQWRTFLHYKPTVGGGWKSQVDAEHFFLSADGKNNPQAELDATVAAFYSDTPKEPLRLTATCRFVARRFWLDDKLGDARELLPQRDCPEYERYVQYLEADTLTLIFPTAHPNSPSSAFGHTLLRIDKKDQRPESRLLNMSINFAAEVPPDVSSTAYAVLGLSGGFPGRFRMLPYHMKLREYGQIENRDTWEYPLILDPSNVDRILRHAYEMLISDFDYFFFSENCSYHLLSLIDVANPDDPMTDHFGSWTIPVDTIRLLRRQGLADEGHFVPSSIGTLQARREGMDDADAQLALDALDNGLPAIDDSLLQLPSERQADVLDLLSDYERYRRLKTDPSARGSNERERAILSRRSKLLVKSRIPDARPSTAPPDAGHGTARVSLGYHTTNDAPDNVELQWRPAYHDFRDPSAAFGDKAAIQLGLVGIAQELETDKVFLRRFTLVSIESIEPRGQFFKPVSWHTRVQWQRKSADASHEFVFNVGAGAAFRLNRTQHDSPVFFVFGESDLVDASAFEKRRHLRLGVSSGIHWEPRAGVRTGMEIDYRHQVGGDYHETVGQLWAGIALADQWSVNVDTRWTRAPDDTSSTQVSVSLRKYF